MDPFDGFDFPDGRIAFLGMVRIDDFGAHEFRIELAGRPPLFGEWEPKFEPNGNDLDVEVISFGYLSKMNVGNPYPDARVCLSQDEMGMARNLILLLFNQTEARSKVVPFSIKKARFTGEVRFKDGWVQSTK